jgi:hypothetical protein
MVRHARQDAGQAVLGIDYVRLLHDGLHLHPIGDPRAFIVGYIETKKNFDGSVTLYFGAKAPKGLKNN